MNKIDFMLPKMVWDVNKYRKKNLYFHLIELNDIKHSSTRINVDGYGQMILLGSYSYLGLIGHPQIQKAALNAINTYGTGTHGVRLLAGTLPIHNKLENKIAQFKSTESSITFTSGYVANVSAISSLLNKRDVVICDKFDHSSIVDGCLLSKAKLKRFKHNNIDHLDFLLKQTKSADKKLVVVDAVFSMDGDIINLPELKKICEKHHALLMVDEAHAIGVLGEKGQGIEEHFNLPVESVDIKMGTLSKTIPSTGGYIAGSKKLITYLKHSARGFIYSASLSPPAVAASLKAFDIIEEEPSRIRTLHKNYKYFANKLRKEGFNILQSQTAIIPIICHTMDKAINMVKFCLENGVFIQAVHPPVVPENTSRLRAIVTSNHTNEDLDYCLEVLKKGARKYNLL